MKSGQKNWAGPSPPSFGQNPKEQLLFFRETRLLLLWLRPDVDCEIDKLAPKTQNICFTWNLVWLVYSECQEEVLFLQESFWGNLNSISFWLAGLTDNSKNMA